jgi:TetR/AcrR family transcriptional repressor of mexJK operon
MMQTSSGGVVPEKEHRPVGKRGRPADSAKSRAILETARILLFKKGPSAVTMEAVAQAAGISKITLYRRYANRAELLRAVVVKETTHITRALRGSPATVTGLRRQLAAFVEDVSAFMCGDRHRKFMEAIGAFEQSRDDLAEIYRNGPGATHRACAKTLATAARRGLLRCPQPLESAEALLALAMGMDLVRAQYRVALRCRTEASRRKHANSVATLFIKLHAVE